MKKATIWMLMMVVMSSAALATMPRATIVDTAIAVNEDTGEFSILIAALAAEGKLINQLSQRGQYTVFAPTDEAFLELFDELGVTPEQVLADKDLLSKVLSYHVARGRQSSTSVVEAPRINTLLRQNFLFSEGTVLTDMNGRTSNIIATDIRTSNGIIHVIDRVVLPKL